MKLNQSKRIVYSAFKSTYWPYQYHPILTGIILTMLTLINIPEEMQYLRLFMPNLSSLIFYQSFTILVPYSSTYNFETGLSPIGEDYLVR